MDMDIARNPDMADAAPTPQEPQVIRREDYRPFPWLVPEIELDFDFSLDATRVTSRLTVARNGKAGPAQTLQL